MHENNVHSRKKYTHCIVAIMQSLYKSTKSIQKSSCRQLMTPVSNNSDRKIIEIIRRTHAKALKMYELIT